MNTFSVLFLIALGVATGTRLWLARRHVQYIQSHRAAVPPEFASEIALDAHQKAADYSSAKTRFGTVHTVVDSVMLLIFTFGGLLLLLDRWAGSVFDNDILHGTALLAAFMVVSSAVDLPFSWLTNRAESRHTRKCSIPRERAASRPVMRARYSATWWSFVGPIESESSSRGAFRTTPIAASPAIFPG